MVRRKPVFRRDEVRTVVGGHNFREEQAMAKTARVKSVENPTVVEVAVTATQRVRPTEEEVAVRAYHIYLERAGSEGSATDDWLRAERKLSEANDSSAE